MCPECGSENVRTERFDFGTCRETGYQDAGEAFRCLDCGATGDAEEIDRLLAEAGLTFAETGAWHRLTRKPAMREERATTAQKVAR